MDSDTVVRNAQQPADSIFSELNKYSRSQGFRSDNNSGNMVMNTAGFVLDTRVALDGLYGP